MPPNFARLEVFHGFRFDQEPIFSYKSPALIDDGDKSLWMVAYTERVVHACEALLLSAYDEYWLWYVPPDIIRFAREHGM